MIKKCIKDEKYSYMFYKYKLKNQLWIVQDRDLDFEYSLIISRFPSPTLEFNFYNENPKQIIISEENFIYSALLKLLNFDAYLEIKNDSVSREKNSFIRLQKIGDKIVIDTTKLNDNNFSEIVVKNYDLIERFNEFFNNLEDIFITKNDIRKLEYKSN